ncbi:MAG: extracellular solute-binding protein [Clostridia bacterium]|nr:extracellular solute-binding protein [Clostridia bacterium]
MNKRILAFLLCLLMTSSALTACGDSTAAETETSVSNDTPETEAVETEPGRENTPDSLPEDLDFEGTTLNIYYFGQETSAKYDGPAELTGDVVTDALYNRNLSVEDRLNVKFNWVKGADGWDSYPAEVLTLLQAGAADFDIYIEENSRLFQQSIKGYFYDLMTKPYIDLEQPWWYTDLMEESSLDNSKRYFLTGDICLTTLFSASAAFFNKDLFIDYFSDENILYEQVMNGEWTMDTFMEYCRSIATDLNGDGVYDANDLMGFRYEQWGIPNYMSMSTGIEYSTRDSEGFPVLNIYNEQSITWADTLYKLLYTDNMSVQGDKTATFEDEKSLFLLGQLSTSHDLRDTNFSFGIVPYPKLDETVDYNSSAATANGCGVAVPVSAASDKLDAVYASIEALCAQAYRTVTPAWYETALKIKYSDDAVDAQMVDLIYETIGSPFIMMADKALGTGSIFTNAVYGASSEGTFTSYWEANQKKFLSSLEKTIEEYKALDVSGN